LVYPISVVEMAEQQRSNLTCLSCGAKLAPELRYCLGCYRPVVNKKRERAHVEAIRAVKTTRGADPTIIFLPAEHEARLRRSRRRKRLIVIGSIALAMIVAGSITTAILSSRQKANQRQMERELMARRELRILADGLERFKVDMGRYPTEREGIGALTRKTAATKTGDDSEGFRYWMGPYIDGVYEVDPWGNDYFYQLKEGGDSFALFSYGPEGEGGSASTLHATSPPATNF
jgi:general secretion pathway protein G